MFTRTVFILAALSSAASAETLTCPVGGERFEAPVSPECGEITGQTMLLAPIGCPLGPMPQCPGNFLPMYRAFSDAEMPLLAQYMQTESYESSVDFSPDLLAYNIEKFLNGPDALLPAWILLRGLWRDPAQLNREPGYLSALGFEFEARISSDTPDENAIMLAQLAFLNVLGGDIPHSRAYFERARNEPARSRLAADYLDAVGKCIEDPSKPHCIATAAMPVR